MQNYETAADIKQKNMEKLSKNAEKMRELEVRMSMVEKKIEEIKLANTKNQIDEKLSKEEVNKLYQDTLLIYEQFNKKLNKRVNEKFVEVFDDVALKIYESEEKRQQLEDKKYELQQILNELQKANADDDERDKKIDTELEYLKSEYEFMTRTYEELVADNLKLNRELVQKVNLINDQNKKLDELKAVIGKLTEVRVILNKYFSSHFENFSQKEKEIINSVNNYRITDPNKYNQAMNELLETKDYGLNNLKTSKELQQSNNFNNNTIKNPNESMDMTNKL